MSQPNTQKPGHWADEVDGEAEVQSARLLHLVQRAGEVGGGVQQDGEDKDADQQVCCMKEKYGKEI